MASDTNKGYFGDNTTVDRFKEDLSQRNSNHVFDGAGENVQYHSDSDSLASKKSRTRYINPAIYIETVESSHSVTSLHTDSSCLDDVITPHPHSSYRSNSTPFLTGRVSSDSSCSIRRKSCRLAEEQIEANYDAEETTRYGQTYREDGPDTFRLSVASLSTTATAKEERERNERVKQEAFQQWCARKEQEKLKKARREKMKLQPAKQTTAEQREESYRQWLERKKLQTERKKADDILRKFQSHDKGDQERTRREKEKEEKLAEWIRRKEEEMKSMKTREERKAARASIEEQRRRSKGEKAYRDWLRTSKNKPLPVPLNQGELSMRGSVSQMYINPVPWQSTT